MSDRDDNDTDETRNRHRVLDVDIAWKPGEGTCTVQGRPVTIMWIDTTLAGLMAGVQSMVGTERFALALQAEGRNSVEDDWWVISRYPDFRRGFQAIANVAAAAGWGRWELVSVDEPARRCVFRIWNSWEGQYQKALGVGWGSAMLAGKMAGICTKLFGVNCWAEQTSFICRGDEYDEFAVSPSERTIEDEIEGLLATDEATRADMAVALKKLGESEARYRALVEHLPGAVYTAALDKDSATLFVSPQIKELLGFSQEEFLSPPQTWRRQLHPEDRDRTLEAVAHSQASGEPLVIEYRMIAKDGATVWIRDEAILIRDADGKPLHVQGVMLDVTSEKQAEAERRQFQAQIQHAQKLESLGVLAGGIAHDFNNLLTVILGNVDLAQMRAPAGAPGKEHLREIEVSARRASDLCRQLLAYSGKGQFVIQAVNLSDVVREMAELLQVSISRKAVLKYDFGKDLPPVAADTAQIRQIIMNLITNASDALDDKPGVISISTGVMHCDRGYLSETYLDDDLAAGTYVYMEVSDTGCGMDEGTKARLFDPFFSTKFAGRGLGLAAVLGIVRGHRGAIKVYSEVGKGSTFKVLFPAAEHAVLPKPAPERHVEPPSFSGTVLLVDDEAGIRAMASTMLRRLGFDVIVAADGVEALKSFRAHRDEIVCVILDLTMPRMDGQECFRELRRIKRDVRVILSSGYNAQETTGKFAGKGLTGFIQKPYQFTNLVETLSDVLKRRSV